jgi:hypothetical protein
MNYISTRMPNLSSNDSVISSKTKKDVLKREITRLLDAGFIKEVYDPYWLANPTLLPKKNKDWRMCVDYTDLNKACKKDSFGLP